MDVWHGSEFNNSTIVYSYNVLRQAVTEANINQDLCRHVVSFAHN